MLYLLNLMPQQAVGTEIFIALLVVGLLFSIIKKFVKLAISLSIIIILIIIIVKLLNL